ncbi:MULTISPECIES: glutamine amidotransferase [unclassified Novosphingobium]|uniref:glutamine amidotransferase n=1 Tax=unclassified Novosphingobium TaxID=2644732 RepID=UPI001469A611|nr:MULTISPECIES: glutamine amidotransferase [unclassified Novosphingobium]NMN04310.1 GMP synthase (glutamine-hydrolysing) [Novosphingobium sp. SG919]NMN85699.1 GMP synthase (glutamine-hydrolysing) [Novosphingobium sp. SG916]
MAKPLLIIQPATSYDDMPAVCALRGDELAWFGAGCGVAPDEILSVKVYQDAPLPDPADVRATIITGAIDMVTDGHSWIERTAAWARTAMAQGAPILGVCFGHQLLAHALGGTVADNPRGAMFGTVDVARTPAGAQDPLFAPLPDRAQMMVFHFQSVLSLPAGADVLATSRHDPHHAVRYAANAWGVQFHPEFDAQIMAGSYDVYADAIGRAGFSVPDLRAANADSAHGQQLLRAFMAAADGA